MELFDRAADANRETLTQFLVAGGRRARRAPACRPDPVPALPGRMGRVGRDHGPGREAEPEACEALLASLRRSRSPWCGCTVRGRSSARTRARASPAASPRWTPGWSSTPAAPTRPVRPGPTSSSMRTQDRVVGYYALTVALARARTRQPDGRREACLATRSRRCSWLGWRSTSRSRGKGSARRSWPTRCRGRSSSSEETGIRLLLVHAVNEEAEELLPALRLRSVPVGSDEPAAADQGHPGDDGSAGG